MRSNPRSTKSSSFQLQLLKSSSSHSGNVRKTKSESLEVRYSESHKTPKTAGLRRSARISNKFQISTGSVSETSGIKRKILADVPVNVKHFKNSQGKPIEDFKAGLDDFSKESNAKDTVDGFEVNLRSDIGPVHPSPAACTWNKKKGVNLRVPILSLTANIDTEETLEQNITSEGIEMEADVDPLDFNAIEVLQIVETTEIFLPSQDQEMEEEDGVENAIDSSDDSKGTKDVDMSPQSMTSIGQIISDIGTNETSPDDSLLAGPSIPVMTHASVRNITRVDLSSGVHAANLSCPDSIMLDSLLHDEGDEELEKIMQALNETQLRMQQWSSGENLWYHIEDDSQLCFFLATVFGICLAIFDFFFR